jgi:hypothetical protein
MDPSFANNSSAQLARKCSLAEQSHEALTETAEAALLCFTGKRCKRTAIKSWGANYPQMPQAERLIKDKVHLLGGLYGSCAMVFTPWFPARAGWKGRERGMEVAAGSRSETAIRLWHISTQATVKGYRLRPNSKPSFC